MTYETIVAPRGGAELVQIPGGSFMMGSPADDPESFDNERPQHAVTLSSFYLAKTPVTNAQYARFVDEHPEVVTHPQWDRDEVMRQPDHPAVLVTWDDAQAYCTWAGLSLPTEAQWEYACRAGTTTRYHSGDRAEDLARVGWSGETSGHRLHATGELGPNAWGLHDMHGNVREWCQDVYVKHYAGARHRPGDGLMIGRESSGRTMRSLRGGDFMHLPVASRSAWRTGVVPEQVFMWLGFRPALSTSIAD